jgi:succinate-acetate transporter protein
MSTDTPTRASSIADPGPLGLAGFAMTTFVLSFHNTGLFHVTPVVFGLAIFYGGIAQLLAGMWEFAKGNTFGATAFCSYGAFWLAFWWLQTKTDLGTATSSQINDSVGLWLLAWFIFTLYMLVASLKTNPFLIAVFLLLAITFLLLSIGAWSATEGITKAGGWFGLLTAVAAWATSFRGVYASVSA